MARPIKKGIDYYPLDVDFLQDIKVRKIMRACGVQSVAILISLLSSIYRDEGYYVVWDSDMSFLVADEVGASEGAVLEVVNKAVQVDFFSKDLFKQYKVLTSRGIQKRFFEAVTRRKRIDLTSEYLLVDLDNEYNNLVNVNINSINDDRSTQSKVKESKVNKSKVTVVQENKLPTELSTELSTNIKDTKNPTATANPKNNPVADMDADSIQQDPALDEGADPSPCEVVERHYAANVLNRTMVGSNDLKTILDACNLYPVEFILEVIDTTLKANKERNGQCTIKSFKYFIPIFQEEWEKRQIKSQPVKPVDNKSYKKDYSKKPNSSKLDMDHDYDMDKIEEMILKRNRGG